MKKFLDVFFAVFVFFDLDIDNNRAFCKKSGLEFYNFARVPKNYTFRKDIFISQISRMIFCSFDTMDKKNILKYINPNYFYYVFKELTRIFYTVEAIYNKDKALDEINKFFKLLKFVDFKVEKIEEGFYCKIFLRKYEAFCFTGHYGSSVDFSDFSFNFENLLKEFRSKLKKEKSDVLYLFGMCSDEYKDLLKIIEEILEILKKEDAECN